MKIGLFSDKQCSSSDKAIRDSILALPFGEAEQQRLLAMQNPARTAQSLGALIALRALIDPLSYPINRTTEGKPYFDAPNAPHFSLSHTDGLAVAALADPTEGRIGIDFEWLHPLDCDRIAARFFSEAELTSYQANPTQDTFFALWTEKEARAKASGNGLFGKKAQPLEAMHVKHFYLKTEGRTGILCVATENAANEPTLSLPPAFEVFEK